MRLLVIVKPNAKTFRFERLNIEVGESSHPELWELSKRFKEPRQYRVLRAVNSDKKEAMGVQRYG